jgi:hypothetical protein
MVSPGNYVVYRDSPTGGAYHGMRVCGWRGIGGDV